MDWFLIGAALLHAAFMIAELFPWEMPLLLRVASKKLPASEPFTEAQRALVSTVVHNSGIYNGIVAGGLLWAAFHGAGAADVAGVMLAGAVAAGIFGTATLKSPVTAIQAVVGVIGLLRLYL